MNYDGELHKAWVDAAMVKAHDFAEAYCNHQCDGENDRLHEMNTARRDLREHLIGQPASMVAENEELLRMNDTQAQTIVALRTALKDICEWADRYTSPGHPITVVAKRALEVKMNDVNCPYCGAKQEINHDDGYGYAEGEVNEGISTEDDDKFEDWNKRLNLFLLEANRDEGRNV